MQTTAEHHTRTDDDTVSAAERTSLRSEISGADFAHAFRHYPGGVAVITADSPDGPVALTATSVISVSAEPPLLAFSISHRASTAPSIRSAQSFVIHFLGKDQVAIAQLCATSGVDRFADARLWARLPTGEPYLPSAPAWVAGTRIDQLDAGAATIILLRATQSAVASRADAAPPLVYFNRSWHHLGEHSQVS